MVAGADRLYALRAEDAQLAYHLSLALREIPGERQSESTAPQGKEPWREGNTGEVQQGKVNSQAGQVGIQPSGGRALGSGYGSERPGQEQGLLCNPGGAKDPVLYRCEDPGPGS